MPYRWLSFDEVYAGMLWSSEYLVQIRRESGAMILTTKREIPMETYVWAERIGMFGPVEPSTSLARVLEAEASVSAVKWFETAPADLRDWMLGEISPLLKVNTSLESV